MKILRENDNLNAAIEVMQHNEQYQDEPRVGIFWYDVFNDELFGIESTLASEARWYNSKQWNKTVKTEKRLHKDYWRKAHYKSKDRRFRGDHTLVPRGRIFEFKDEGFRICVGDWIDEYLHVKQMILDEFELPEDTQIIKDIHWNIGHGFSDEF